MPLLNASEKMKFWNNFFDAVQYRKILFRRKETHDVSPKNCLLFTDYVRHYAT